MVRALTCYLLFSIAGHSEAFSKTGGLPVTRVYPLEEIGNISRGGQLTYDRFGRVTIVQDGAFIVLNDYSWKDIAAPTKGIKILKAAYDDKTTTYYGALGSWGRLMTDRTGNLYPQSLVPNDCPKWVATTNFTHILTTHSATYIAGWNGIVVLDPVNNTQRFLEVPEIATIFTLGETVFVSSHVLGLLKFDPQAVTLAPANLSNMDARTVVNHCAHFSSSKALLTSTDRRFLLWDKGQITEFFSPLKSAASGQFTALQLLAEGDVAIAILNAGVYIMNQDGQIKLALTGPNYRYVTGLAAKEPGVLWAMTENSVQKIFYGGPITVFSQSLGISIEWPQVLSWNGQTMAASAGHLYESKPGAIGEPARFERVQTEPVPGTWGIATYGSWLLTSNARGVYGRQPDKDFELILDRINPARLAMTKSEICLVIGSEEIAALRYNQGRWEECAPRIKGVGFPSIIHTTASAVWIELGANRAARVTLRAGKLEARVFDSFPWSEAYWVNISQIGDTVVLIGSDDKRLFFDEKTETFIDAPPELKNIIDLCPLPPYRLAKDSQNTIWASMQRGLVRFIERGGVHTIDSATYDLINESIPIVNTLLDNDIWISTGVSLYHSSSLPAPVSLPGFHPVIVAIHDSRTNSALSLDSLTVGKPPRFSASQNSLSFTCFAASYRYRLPPQYEFRINNGTWNSFNQGSTLVLSDLREGNYALEARLVGQRGPIGTSMRFDFTVEPPWHRTWLAYIFYPIIAGTIIFGILRYSIRLARKRNEALEKLVTDRTQELKATMEKLHNETVTSTMLAERGRLANEIHDSLEQGFTGLQFQLETTANFPNCSPEIKSGLSVALNMISYSRSEVRHAVRNLHAPILATADLATAVRHIVAQIAPEPNFATVTATGAPRRLEMTIEHHLLRIAQEAMTNVVKHSNATHADVIIDFRAHEVELSIRDNGKGFDPVVVLKPEIGQFGLPSFRGRASAIGGTVDIASTPGAGTCITVKVPLRSPSTN